MKKSILYLFVFCCFALTLVNCKKNKDVEPKKEEPTSEPEPEPKPEEPPVTPKKSCKLAKITAEIPGKDNVDQTFEYDDKGRLSFVNIDGATNTKNNYDEKDRITGFSYTKDGKDYKVTLTYDGSKITATYEEKTSEASDFTQTQQKTMEFDEEGKVIKINNSATDFYSFEYKDGNIDKIFNYDTKSSTTIPGKQLSEYDTKNNIVYEDKNLQIFFWLNLYPDLYILFSKNNPKKIVVKKYVKTSFFTGFLDVTATVAIDGYNSSDYPLKTTQTVAGGSIDDTTTLLEYADCEKE